MMVLNERTVNYVGNLTMNKIVAGKRCQVVDSKPGGRIASRKTWKISIYLRILE